MKVVDLDPRPDVIGIWNVDIKPDGEVAVRGWFFEDLHRRCGVSLINNLIER
jgi:hypothetical protein